MTMIPLHTSACSGLPYTWTFLALFSQANITCMTHTVHLLLPPLPFISIPLSESVHHQIQLK